MEIKLKNEFVLQLPIDSDKYSIFVFGYDTFTSSEKLSDDDENVKYSKGFANAHYFYPISGSWSIQPG